MSLRKPFGRLGQVVRRRNGLAARTVNPNLVPACIETLEVRTVLSAIVPGLDQHGLVIENGQVAGQSSLLVDSSSNSQLSYNLQGSGLVINLDNSSGQIDSLKSVVLRDIRVENNGNAGIQINLSNITLDRLAINRAWVTDNGGAGLVLNLDNATIGELVIWDSANQTLWPTPNSGDSRYSSNASDGIHVQGQNSNIGTWRLTGNVARDNDGHGALFNLDDVSVTNFVLDDNELLNNLGGSGAHFETNRTNLAGSIVRNTITDNSSHGLSFVTQSLEDDELTPTPSPSNFDFGTFSDNDISDNTGSGVSVNLREKTTWDATLQRNTINRNGIRGLDLTAADTESGFDVQIGGLATNAQGVLINGNTFDANVGAAIALVLNDTSGNTSNTTGRFRILGNTITDTLNDPASRIYNGEGISVRALGDVTRQNGAARFFSSRIDRNTIERNDGDGVRFNLSEDSELVDLTIGNLTGPQLAFDVNGASPGGNIVAKPGDGNVIRNNGGNGISILRLASSIVEKVRILDNRITDNAEGIYLQASNTYQTVPNAARPNLRVVSGFDLRNNDISGNRLNGVHLRTEFNAVLLADLYYNRIDGNALNGIRVTGLENNATDFENVGGVWIKNAITNNGTNTVRAALGLPALPAADEHGNGIRIENVVGSVNPLVIGRDGLDTDNQSFGNYIARNGSDGIEIGARAGGGAGGTTTMPVDIRDGLEIVNNQIIENGLNGVGDSYFAGKGIDIEVLPGQPREFRIDRNIIQGNSGDGIELLNSGGKLRLTAVGNFIDLNGGRGVDILNRALAPNGFGAEATIVFGDEDGNGQVNRNIVTRNGLEGVYVVNTVAPTQTQNVSSEVALETVTIGGSRIEAVTLANLLLDIENNEIRDNGLGVAEQGSPPSFLSGTGLVLRVGSQGSAGSFGVVPDISGYASAFSSAALAGVGTNGFNGGNSVSGGFSSTANGRVNARIVDNEFSGNGGDDVLLESFVSLMPRDTPGTWSATEFRDINFYDRDPLARLNLEFTGNTGDSVDVVRGTGANDSQTYSFTNAEGDFKSRTSKTGDNPSGPFGNNASRDRVITRVADRPVSGAGFDGTLASSYPDTYSGIFSSFYGAPNSGPNRPQAGFGSTSGTIGLIDGTDTSSAIRVTVASRTGVVQDATNADPSVITSSNHGLFTGDEITITGATGNTNINGTWIVQRLSADTFQLRDPATNALVAGNAAYDANSASWVLAGEHRLSTGDVVSLTGTGRTDVNGTHVVQVIDTATFAIYIPNVISQETAVRGWGGTTSGGSFIEHNRSKFHYDGIGPSTFRVEANQSVSGFRANQLGDNFLTSTSVGSSPVSIGWDRVAAGTFSYLTASIGDATVNEADGSVDVTVTLSEDAPPEGVTIFYRTSDGSAKADPNNDGDFSDGDYVPVTSSFIFIPAGSRTGTISIQILDDTAFDQVEQFYVDLYQISTGDFVDSRGVVTITPDGDPPATITVGDVTVDEITGQAVFTVQLSNASSEVVTVDYTTVDGTAKNGRDYESRSGTLTFSPGVTSISLPIVVTADMLDETDETFRIRLSNARNAAITTTAATATIRDTRFFSVSDVQVGEGGKAFVTISLNEQLPDGVTASVNYTTANGNATSGGDYDVETGTLNFSGTTTVQTIEIQTNADGIQEGDEVFFVNLSGAANAGIAAASGRITIVDPWEAEGAAVGHLIGRADGDGWSANTAQDSPGYLLYGPYTTVIPGGFQTASFRLQVDNNTADDAKVARIDVFDASAGRVLAQRVITRREFEAAMQYQNFDLPFRNTVDESSSSGMQVRQEWDRRSAPPQLEFRVFWFDTSYVKVDNVRVSTAPVAPLVLEAEQDLSHQIGRAAADGWTANTTQDDQGFLAFGPYTTAIPAGPQSATFRLQVDNNTADNAGIVTIDVYDASVGRTLAQRVIRRTDFRLANVYQEFVLDFDNAFDSRLEFRVRWHDTSFVKLDRVIVSMTPTPPLLKFEAESDLVTSIIGRRTADGWSANTAQDSAGFLAFGPYTTAVPAGSHVALFRLLVDNVTANNAPIVTIDVMDMSDPARPQVLGRRTITRQEFEAAFEYQNFTLAFTNSAGANLEFRVFWHGTSFVQLDHVAVVDVPAPQRLFEAEANAAGHPIGRATANGNGWSANTAQDTPGFMVTGPYNNGSLPAGAYTAAFRLLVDNNTADNASIVSIDVFNRATGQVLAQRTITRLEFLGASVSQNFMLSFVSPAGADLEFRTFWHGTSYVEQDYVRVLPMGFSASAELEPVFEEIDELLLMS